jgi:fumarate reductase subunit C
MRARLKNFIGYSTPPKRIVKPLFIVLMVIMLCTGTAMAQDGQEELKNKISNVADFLVVIIIALAAPNALYGAFEWMTAGASVEKDERGRKRLRNTFIALGIAAIARVGVEVMVNMMGVEQAGGGGNETEGVITTTMDLAMAGFVEVLAYVPL